MFVPDASGEVELVLNTAAGRRIASRLDAPAESVHAPRLIDVEVAHVLHRGALLGTQCRTLRTSAQPLARARRRSLFPYLFLDACGNSATNVSAYDAAYVALTEALSTVLVTGDGRLQRIPGLAIRIELA